MNIIIFLSLLVIFFGSINLLRMAMFLVGSDIYYVKNKASNIRKRSSKKLPSISVVIPAYNEEDLIERCVTSVIKNNYPKEKLEIVVVDDGSKDETYKIARSLKNKNKGIKLDVVRQENSGKAVALNRGIKYHSHGELVMCLDSDSYLHENALINAVKYFEDTSVKALASNVKIVTREGMLNLIQRFEYIVCYQMKRAQTVFNIEYIVGGIGSIFRRSTLEEVGYYDGDTVTEDIDLTMKVLQKGNKANRVIYGADVIAYTEAVLDIRGLIRQRYRWKWGRCQTFLKNKNMFFNRDSRFSKGLTYFYLPFAIFGDIAYFLEPVLLTFILVVAIRFRDPVIILTAMTVISVYMLMIVVREDTLSTKEKLFFALIIPPMYFYFFLLSFVEYVALIKAMVNIRGLRKSIDDAVCSWEHVDRPSNKLIA